MIKKTVAFLILGLSVFVPMQTIQAEKEAISQSTTFGINLANNAPDTNPVYIYGNGSVNVWIPAYSGQSVGPFDPGPYYSVIMYANSTGSHTFTFSGPIQGGGYFNESITTSSGSATFHPGYLVGNSSGSITYNGM